MSSIDPEVLYLILTKTSARESFYGFDAMNPGPGQPPGTITPRQIAGVYERITGHRVGTRVNWVPPLTQLNALLARCALPPLGTLVRLETAGEPSATATPGALDRVHATKWPTFGALKTLLLPRKT